MSTKAPDVRQSTDGWYRERAEYCRTGAEAADEPEIARHMAELARHYEDRAADLLRDAEARRASIVRFPRAA